MRFAAQSRSDPADGFIPQPSVPREPCGLYRKRLLRGDERAFYQWSAGVLGNYPITPTEFAFGEKLMPFTAFDETGIIGFFTLRQPGETAEELRLGFVIVKPNMRGKGYGKAMLRLGIKFAFDHGAKRVSLGVFENNPSAYYCYKSVGFNDITFDNTETYCILGEEWKYKELILNKTKAFDVIPQIRIVYSTELKDRRFVTSTGSKQI